jgi:hypothetical protein
MLRTSVAVITFVGFLAPMLSRVVAAPPASPDPKSLAVPQEELSKARELVQKLGSETFQEREAAERDLAAMGRLARAALLAGVNTDPDPEVRLRCHTLLPKANAEDLKARIDTFMADTEGKYEHDLPGWHQLRATVRGQSKLFGWTHTVRPGAEKAARELFIEFLKAPGGPQLLGALGGPPADLGALVATRKQELYNTRFPRPGTAPRNPSLMEVAVVVFAESQVHSRHIPRSMNVMTVLSTSGLPGATQGSDDRALALRTVLNAWFDSRTDSAELYTAFNLATTLNNHDTIGRLATRLLTTPGVIANYKGQALATLVRLKMADQVPALEKAFTDSGTLGVTVQIVNGVQVRKTIEVRDAALAAALVLTGQDPNEYGFDSFPKHAGAGFSYVWAKIPEDKRKDAFEKWAKWREKNP